MIVINISFIGEIPSFKLFETPTAYSFLDIQPTTEGHALIIPKHHGAKLHDIPDEFLSDVLPICKKMAKLFDVDNAGSDGIGYNILQNNGRIAHQEVDHVHFHFIPKKDVKTGLVVGWPTQETDFAKLTKLYESLKPKLETL